MGRALRGVLTGVGCIAVIGAVLVVVVIIVVAVSLGSGEGGGEQDSQTVVARVSGTEGLKFSGNVSTLDSGRSVDGTVPDEYGFKDVDTSSLSTDTVSIVMQKKGRPGEMVCEIVVGDEVVKESSTTAEFGTCDLTWSASE